VEGDRNHLHGAPAGRLRQPRAGPSFAPSGALCVCWWVAHHGFAPVATIKRPVRGAETSPSYRPRPAFHQPQAAAPPWVAEMLYDLFICHASEDKESFVRPLIDAQSRTDNIPTENGFLAARATPPLCLTAVATKRILQISVGVGNGTRRGQRGCRNEYREHPPSRYVGGPTAVASERVS